MSPDLQARLAAVPWQDVRSTGTPPGTADALQIVVLAAGHRAVLSDPAAADPDAVQRAALAAADAALDAARAPREGGDCRPA